MRRRVARLLFTLEKRRRPHTAHDQIRMRRKRPAPTPAVQLVQKYLP
jgi:hypothetical protein